MTKQDIDIYHLAELARLELSEAEVVRFHTELLGVLGYVEQLREVDVTDYEETAQVTGVADVLRADTEEEITQEELQDRRTELLRSAPSQKDGLIKVPAILE